ncbi:hypothetical protein B0A49_01574 [Cryomyces minteri]|uniref:Uracil catabolism protein 4 n=1 Tax=Cryomyces minteri TaxID=331657 RepID=A0A4U0XTP3_9PEZI|nr:hypothetical protein B0A49_01574 [Cryomyces minteri]
MGLFSRKNSKPNSGSPDSQSAFSNGPKSSSMSTRKTTNGSSLGASSVLDIPIPRAPDPALDPAAYLRSVHSVRERSRFVLEKAKKNQLKHFHVDLSKFQDTASYVVSIIKRDYAPDYASIPPHGRWQHFDVGGRPRIDQLMGSWASTVDAQERTRRLIDLFLVSVLLDAGAGTQWRYKSKESGKVYRRSEGLAVASLEMFKTGMFSSDPNNPYRVDSAGLKKLDVTAMAGGLQVSEHNPIEGLQGRTNLLIRLADALQNQDLFGTEARPGGMLEYRNGGLLVDTGLLTLKEFDARRGLEMWRDVAGRGGNCVEVVPTFEASDDVIVEWRAVTVGFLDELLAEVNVLLRLNGSEKLSLAQMLEAGTWKGGRELAEVSRPNTKEPPIMILSDGTVF